jgi:hypothetical protein
MVQHLPEYGWEPGVLTCSPSAYERTSDDLLTEVPPSTFVRRALTLDAARHLAVRGRFWSALARPDRWASWRFDAVRVGKQMLRDWQPIVLWSTYPIATAHVIGHHLQARSGLPWVADFRDPMAQEGYPSDPLTWEHYRRIEEDVFRSASLAVFTTPGAARTYRARYHESSTHIEVVENGYDEEAFAALQGSTIRRECTDRPLVVLHSGIVYPSERDPTALFAALADLRATGLLTPRELRVRFRAAVHEALLTELAAAYGVGDFIEVEPAVGYRQALSEMLEADALLVMQAANCNEQIPAKLYEYLRAGRPIIGLTDPGGDTAGVLNRAQIPYIAPLDQPNAISRTLLDVVEALRAGTASRPDNVAVLCASRRQRARELALLLDEVTAARTLRRRFA